MASPLFEKFRLWQESGKGVKSRFDSSVSDPVVKRSDIASATKELKLDRGDRMQRARLNYYPSINVDNDQLFAGYIIGDLDDAEDALQRMGYRNNPTAYVEVTETDGPDDGSYARQRITETGGGDRIHLTNFPSFYKRKKEQIHVVVFKKSDRVEFLAHEERSAWLQPMLHVTVNNAKARVGVRDFRNDWYDEFGRELEGKEETNWNTSR
jgi:hypothetical protein